jgi:CDP-diacylglycerol---serine O-phosphatidyltransferase
LKQHIPNLLTCLNLLSGCMAVVFVFRGEIPVFAALTGLSLVFDFLDGLAARRLKAQSSIGKELDSLADMVSFGLVPGAILYHMFINSVPASMHMDSTWVKILSFFPFIVTVFSALRLARFNVDTRQTDSFIGMPTPSVTIFVVGLALVLQYDRFHLSPQLLNSYVIGGLSMVLSYLLVADIRMLALKFNSFSWSRNQPQYLLILLSVLLVTFLGVAGIPAIIILYLFLSLIYYSKPTIQ